MAIAAAVSSNDVLKGVPENVLRELQKMKSMFTINRETLRTVTDKFVTELENGRPTGQEQGTFITIDLGGTNLRVCKVELTKELGGYKITQRKFKLPVQHRQRSVDDLWALVADKLEESMESQHTTKGKEALPLGITFSYPVTQHNIRRGSCSVGRRAPIFLALRDMTSLPSWSTSLHREDNLPVEIVALVNHTTGTLVATAYQYAQVKVSSIFITGCNPAYIEDCGLVTKIASYDLPAGKEMAIHTGYGAFNNSHSVLPRNVFDEAIESTSRPGQQTYEKMVAALYFGELVRLIVLHLHHTTGLFTDSMESTFLSAMEGGPLGSLGEMQALFRERFNIEPKTKELKICRLVAEIACTRAARLYACGITAICKKKGIESYHVAVDASTLFGERAAAALREI
ncbi:hexokinase [Aspergillus flavus]|nr:hexokinase [Aspergillus flavus]